jgi:hypothetical protein
MKNYGATKSCLAALMRFIDVLARRTFYTSSHNTLKIGQSVWSALAYFCVAGPILKGFPHSRPSQCQFGYSVVVKCSSRICRRLD